MRRVAFWLGIAVLVVPFIAGLAVLVHKAMTEDAVPLITLGVVVMWLLIVVGLVEWGQRKPRRRGVAILFLLLLSGCANDPESSHTTSNPEFQVGKLFEHDGCTVYRFSDNGRFVYYVNCGHSTRTSYQESCGKGCSQEFAVPGSSCTQ